MKKICIMILLGVSVWWMSQATEDNMVCTMQYEPVCAEVQVQCIKAPCPAIKETFGNKCMMNANKLAKFLYEWECKKDIDLSKCESYFDGCNTCFVSYGKIGWCTLRYCETPAEPRCLKYKEHISNMANPASKFCIENSGTLEMLDWTWGQYGVCKFADGSTCEEWNYFKWECKPEYKKIHNIFDSFFDKYANRFKKFEDRKVFLEEFKLNIQSLSKWARLWLKKTYNKIIQAIELYR